MTIKELIEKLKEYDENEKVYLQQHLYEQCYEILNIECIEIGDTEDDLFDAVVLCSEIEEPI